MRKFVVYLGVGLVLRQLRRTVLRLLLDLIVVRFVEVQHLGLVLIVLLLQLRVEDVAAFDRVVLVDYLGNVCYLWVRSVKKLNWVLLYENDVAPTFVVVDFGRLLLRYLLCYGCFFVGSFFLIVVFLIYLLLLLRLHKKYISGRQVNLYFLIFLTIFTTFFLIISLFFFLFNSSLHSPQHIIRRYFLILQPFCTLTAFFSALLKVQMFIFSLGYFLLIF